jgi:hypothetical protein
VYRYAWTSTNPASSIHAADFLPQSRSMPLRVSKPSRTQRSQDYWSLTMLLSW